MAEGISVTGVWVKYSKGKYHVWQEYGGRTRTRVSIQSDKQEAFALVKRLKIAHGLIRDTEELAIGAIIGKKTLQ